MQAFIYWHNVPSQDFVLSVVKPGPFALSADVPPGKPLEVTQGGNVKVVVKAARREKAKGPISLSGDTPPKGITVKRANIAPDKDQAEIVITAQKQAPVGLQQNIIITGTVKAGKKSVTRFAPAIPIKVVAAKSSKSKSESKSDKKGKK